MIRKLSWPLLIGVITLLIVVTTGVNLAPRLGWTVGEIGSDSMLPVLDIGTLVVARQVDPRELKTGDIIVYQPRPDAQHAICHRIVAVLDTTPRSFLTQGDNNRLPDEPLVSADNVVGKVYLSIPYLGYFVQFLKTGAGLMLGLVLPALMLIWLCAWQLWREIRKTAQSNYKAKVVVVHEQV